jgi:hypothetical protein
MMKIKWKDGTRFKTKVEDAHQEIDRVRALSGSGDLNLQDLVDESKPKDSVLHDDFEWSNPKAANFWRLSEARKMQRCLIVEEDKATGKPEHRYMESVRVVETPKKEGDKPKVSYVFRRTEDILADPDARDELLGQAIKEALAFKKRFNSLQELAKIFAALDEVLMEVDVKIKA